MIGHPLCSPCQFGHTTHDTTALHINLDGQPAVPDYPAIPSNLALNFPFTVFDTTSYETDESGFCSGRDELSRSISQQGIWEGFITLLTLTLLRPRDVFIDFGAHVGWYSAIAAHKGCRIIAYECNVENIRLFYQNVPDYGHNLLLVPGWVDADTDALEPKHFDTAIRLVKMDLESWEDQAVGVIRRLLYYKLIDYIVMEVSPIFASHYAKTVQRVLDFGYQAFIIPGKGSETEFARDPLKLTFTTPFTIADIANTEQADILFVRDDLVGRPA